MSAPYKTNLRDNQKPSTKEPLYLKSLKNRVGRKDQLAKAQRSERTA